MAPDLPLKHSLIVAVENDELPIVIHCLKQTGITPKKPDPFGSRYKKNPQTNPPLPKIEILFQKAISARAPRMVAFLSSVFPARPLSDYSKAVALWNPSFDTLQACLEHDRSLVHFDLQGQSPLKLYCDKKRDLKGDSVRLVKLLLHYGAAPNMGTTREPLVSSILAANIDENLAFPLSVAVESGQPKELLEKLIDHGAMVYTTTITRANLADRVELTGFLESKRRQLFSHCQSGLMRDANGQNAHKRKSESKESEEVKIKKIRFADDVNGVARDKRVSVYTKHSLRRRFRKAVKNKAKETSEEVFVDMEEKMEEEPEEDGMIEFDGTGDEISDWQRDRVELNRNVRYRAARGTMEARVVRHWEDRGWWLGWLTFRQGCNVM
ncbi:MAG: hypothetical protein MMC23_004669 [Stictis urceolatum]|nr:hypothetical protein [Stictis urceolata]